MVIIVLATLQRKKMIFSHVIFTQLCRIHYLVIICPTGQINTVQPTTLPHYLGYTMVVIHPLSLYLMAINLVVGYDHQISMMQQQLA